MKKLVITTILSLSAIFLMIPKANAQIITSFGSFPDFSLDNSDYMIIQPKDSSLGDTYLVRAVPNSTFTYTQFRNTSISNFWISFYGSGTNPQVDFYTLNGDSWVYHSSLTSLGYSKRIFSIDYTNFNVATTLDFYTNINNRYVKLYDAGYGFDLFKVEYEQGEVLMADYENSSANLVSQYINTDLNVNDYVFSYSINTGSDNIFSQEYNPICTETSVDNHNHYTCYYNIPLFYNTTLTFYITDKSTNEVVYQQDYVAYLDFLPDTSYYTIYELNNYKYANISNIDNGTFGVTESLSNDINIYVTDINTSNNIDFLTSQYYVSTHIENGVKFWEFNFNGNTNLYLSIEIRNNELWNDSTNNYYLFSPSSAYTHLSGMANLKENQDNPVNQQAYKDDNGTIHYINNPISYDDYENNFYSQSNSVISSTMNFVKGTTNILSNFITSLDSSIQYTIYACFSFLLVSIIFMLFKH